MFVAGVAATFVVALLGSAVAGAASRTPVVASFYPIAWAAQQVGGNRVAVTNLTPAGAEPHDLELTPDQIDEVLDAKVVFELGRGFQPAVEHAAEQRDGPTVELLPRGTERPARLARPGAHGEHRPHRAARAHEGRSEGARACYARNAAACARRARPRSTLAIATASRTASAT